MLINNHNATISEDGVITRLDGYVHKASRDRYGYARVHLTDNDGKRTGHFVHRLLAAAYIPNPDNKRCVDHIDGDKTNNALSNLRWCSHKENTKFAIDLKLWNPKTANAKEIRAKAVNMLYATGEFTMDDLAAAFECTYNNIQSFVARAKDEE